MWQSSLCLDLIIWCGLQRKAKETHCWFTADSACYQEMESSHALFNKVLSFTKILKQVCQRKNPREVYFGRIFVPFCISFYANVFNVSNVQYLSLCCCGHAFIRLWLRNGLALKVDSWQGGEAIAVIGDCNQFLWCRAFGISFEVAVRGKQSLKQGEATMTEATTEDNEWLFIVSEHFHESNSDLEEAQSAYCSGHILSRRLI